MVRDCDTANADRGGSHREGRTAVKILLVEDSLADARLLQEILKGAMFSRFSVTHTQRLSEAIRSLVSTPFDVILLDLTLPDSAGLDSLNVLLQNAPHLPIVVLTHTSDHDLAVEAVRRGAQDYLVKRQMTQDSLGRSLRYAIERKQAAEALREVNEILELRVKERTAELETANRLLTQEIASRQQVQQRLELAQQAGRIGNFEWNLAEGRVTWSAELEALYGVAPGDFGEGYEGWSARLHSDERDRVWQEFHQACQRGQGLETEFRIVWPNQEVRWICVKSSVFHSQQQEPLRMIGIHMDITEKKQLEAQFLRAQRLESLGTLASGIAHDLNNVLTPVLAGAQLLSLKLPALDPATRQLLTLLESSARRGADLVKQILSFARGVEGKRMILQLHYLLMEIEDMIRQTLPPAITIEMEVPESLWPIGGDATQLHQVFMNLCVNARDAMPQGGMLSVRAENQFLDERSARKHLDATPGLYVVVTIRDTGTGIPPEILHRIFDPFFTTKEIGKGTGLGLSAVLGIVKSHGGFVDVQSELNQGSQFQIYLPANQSEVPRGNDPLEALAGHQELILVVDDESVICETTRMTLETYNYRVLTARTGMEAITLLSQHQHEVFSVLMDLMMPSLDGFATIPLMHRLNPNLYAVAMSGLNSVEVVTQAQEMGFQEFLSKPFTTYDLLQRLQLGVQSTRSLIEI
ncbi:MAG: response regulator [Leptolyngbyaceae cyanobacterium bins.59]|nr:response regulator [Leptolyngbyaceae cyanobacterium bins.59]